MLLYGSFTWKNLVILIYKPFHEFDLPIQTINPVFNNTNNTTGGAESTYSSGSPEFNPSFDGFPVDTMEQRYMNVTKGFAYFH